jgi:hypothetical protein
MFATERVNQRDRGYSARGGKVLVHGRALILEAEPLRRGWEFVSKELLQGRTTFFGCKADTSRCNLGRPGPL